MVTVHFKDGTSQAFNSSVSIAPYSPDSLFTAIMTQSNGPEGAVLTDFIEWVDLPLS